MLRFASLRAAFSRLSPFGRLTRFFREVKVVKGFAVSNLEVCEVTNAEMKMGVLKVDVEAKEHAIQGL